MTTMTVKQLLVHLRELQQNGTHVNKDELRELVAILVDLVEESALADELSKIRRQLDDELMLRIPTPVAGSLGPTGSGSTKGSLG